MSYDVNSLEAHWMPFSANRDFKKDPRIVVKSEGMYMWDYKGGEIIDGSSALFCTPLGHGRREIAEAVYQHLGKSHHQQQVLSIEPVAALIGTSYHGFRS